MAHLLVIENWVEGTGRLLPETIKKLGHEYSFVTRNPGHYENVLAADIHPIFEHATRVFTAETNDVSALIEFLQDKHEQLNFDGVITICDYYIGTVAEVAAALHLPQSFSSNVTNIRKKHYVRQTIQNAQLGNPLFRVTSTWPETEIAAQEIGFPLIVKPSDLASSAFVKLVQNKNELYKAFSELEKFTYNFRAQKREPVWLLEEYMEGEEISVEAFTFDGKTTVIGITDKGVTGFPYFIEDSHMFPAALDAEVAQRIETYVANVLAAVGHDHGISHTEVKLTDKGLRIVEINSRPGGNFIAELIEHVTGINLLEVHINLALDKPPVLENLAQKQGSAAVKFIVPPNAGVIEKISGVEKLDSCEHIVRWNIKSIENNEVPTPIDNACYLGHVIAVDKDGSNARRYAEKAISQLHINYAIKVSSELATEEQ